MFCSSGPIPGMILSGWQKRAVSVRPTSDLVTWALKSGSQRRPVPLKAWLDRAASCPRSSKATLPSSVLRRAFDRDESQRFYRRPLSLELQAQLFENVEQRRRRGIRERLLLRARRLAVGTGLDRYRFLWPPAGCLNVEEPHQRGFIDDRPSRPVLDELGKVGYVRAIGMDSSAPAPVGCVARHDIGFSDPACAIFFVQIGLF